MWVIDVGCSPGGWCQVLAKLVDSEQNKETVVGIDLLHMEPIRGVKFLQGDIRDESTQEKLSKLLDYQKADVITSDAVPDFIGDKFIDHLEANSLNMDVVWFCKIGLRVGGNAVIKIIQGPETDEVVDEVTNLFNSVQKIKPSASRSESAETYLLLRGYQ